MRSFESYFLVLFLLPLSAHAVLGERSQSALIMNTDASTNSEMVIKTTTVNGNEIKEFSDSTGFVYAVSWEGASLPNVSQLIGQYFPEYKAALAAPNHHVIRRRIASDSDNLHISQFGHPGALNGLIYLKKQLPAQVRPEDLK